MRNCSASPTGTTVCSELLTEVPLGTPAGDAVARALTDPAVAGAVVAALEHSPRGR